MYIHLHTDIYTGVELEDTWSPNLPFPLLSSLLRPGSLLRAPLTLVRVTGLRTLSLSAEKFLSPLLPLPACLFSSAGVWGSSWTHHTLTFPGTL